MDKSSAAPQRRLVGLDVLRAVAVLLVLGRHVQYPLVGWSAASEAALTVWTCGGWTGVDLFFVLSGFLVSGLLFREYQTHGGVSVGRFLVRRGLKIYPAFYAFFALTVAIAAVHWGTRTLSASAVAAELFFVQNYGDGLWWHTWSLAVEEHFYLLVAGLVFVLTRLGRGSPDPYRAIPYVFAFVAAGCLGGRLLTAAAIPYADRPHVFATHLRIDGLMFGVMLSYLWHFHEEAVERLVRGRVPFLWAAGVALLAPAFLLELRETPFVYTYGFTSFYVGSGCLVLAVVVGGLPNVAAVRAVARIGAFSYSIYLWHLWVLFEVQRMFGAHLVVHPSSPVGVLAYMAGSVLVGVAMAKLVEYPALALRDRIFPSRASALPTPSSAPADLPSPAFPGSPGT